MNKQIERALGALADCRIVVVADHQVGVDVAVAGVAETGDRDAGVRLQPLANSTRSTSFERGTTMSSLSLVRPVSRRA